MKNTFIILLSFYCSLFSCQQTYKKMRIFNREITIPDINKTPEKLSLKEIKIFDAKNKTALEHVLERKKLILKTNSRETLPDTINIQFSTFDSGPNITRYFFNNATKGFGTLIYFDSDPLLKDKTLLEAYINAQPMRFNLSKVYDSNGHLKMKRLSFSRVIIKDYEYDESGKLTKDDEPAKTFRLSVIEVLKILEKNNININFEVNRLSASPSTYLSSFNTNRGKIWHLEQYENEQESIIFDSTGKIISQVRSHEEPGRFLVISLPTFKNRYKDKSLEEVERETGLTIYLQK